MSDSYNSITTDTSEKDLFKDICNALECNNKATQTVSINAGSFGTITLNVCKNCIGLFEGEN